MSSDTHAFYNSLICDNESKRTLKRQQTMENKNDLKKNLKIYQKKKKKFQ